MICRGVRLANALYTISRLQFEHGTKIPLMIGCPGGKCVGRTPALVESIDIYPTLLEEAGITVPSCPTNMAASRKVQPTPLNGQKRLA